ncbi:uncharacterized protein MONBRDRAFT_27047 [Monosiga brevicollis MX1]|uniref:Ricin B lectin domain-containing protein n=1 Tax=Monosiga brevicollis TaxID=81824 RepID=A9V457_MONBE|nr:uncharacterized protein MONBRDRAFT_27047 [Monosiga brevicollis MX1]EDQ87561.1 predicted protein [Monosiga brevicollis MX1]|eukprot:XP_001747481.1 hypothetical protein [Monosiga brevicollis MX1]
MNRNVVGRLPVLALLVWASLVALAHAAGDPDGPQCNATLQGWAAASEVKPCILRLANCLAATQARRLNLPWLVPVAHAGKTPTTTRSNAVKRQVWWVQRMGGIVEEYTLDNAINNPNHVAELFSLELYNKIRMEPNLQYFLNTWLVSVVKNGTQIVTAVAEDQQSQNRYIINARQFIDASGDGRLGAEAGAEFIMGREGPSDFNESLAEGPDSETEGSSLAFVAVEMDTPQTYRAPPWARKFNATDFKFRGLSDMQYGYWWIEISWPYNTVTDNEPIRDRLFENLFGVWDYIKNSGQVSGSSHWALQWFGQVPCKREGRRFRGLYVSSQNDIMRNPNADPPQVPDLYYDRVAFAGWNFDLHNPKGMFDTAHPPYVAYKSPYMFSTPLRSLISKDVDNLFFAGRLGSFSHVVFGSQRVMKTCSTMGQAVGTAAALAARLGCKALDLPSNPEALWSLQQQLIRDDAYLIGVLNEDPRDYARNASVQASTELFAGGIDGRARNVLTGQTRAVVTPLQAHTGMGGVPVGQGINGTNRWMSTKLPAWMTLSLPQPAKVRQAQLTFDTGMHRLLTFAVRDYRFGIWKAQPETVRDYTIEGLVEGQWQLLCNITGNYQRRRVHSLPCSPIHPDPGTPSGGGSSPLPPASAADVRASTCDPSAPSQLWTLNAHGQLQNLQGAQLCLTFSNSSAAYQAHGNAIQVAPCATAPTWRLDPTLINGTTVRLESSVPCIDYQGECQCAKFVASNHEVQEGAGVELWSCTDMGSEGTWTFLQKSSKNNAFMIATGGYCLDHQTPFASSAYAAHRNQAQTAADALGLQNSATAYSDIRINVTATNGIDRAHILEVRLYDEEGQKPFPRYGGTSF